MKLIGIVFIVLSAGTVGCSMAMSMKKKCLLLRQLLDALQILKNELSVCATPLPQAFGLMAVSSTGELEAVFSAVAKDMDRNRWITPYDAFQALWKDKPQEPWQQVLLSLARKLGKYDLDAQLQGIETAKCATAQILSQMERERSMKSRTYETLAICAGLAVAILLI